MKRQLGSTTDATMKVSIEVLKKVYMSLQDQDEGGGGGGGVEGAEYRDGLNPENHLWFVDSYEMPRWHWSNERGAFERYVSFSPSQCNLFKSPF